MHAPHDSPAAGPAAAQFGLLIPNERWLAEIPSMGIGALAGGSVCMLLVGGALEFAGKPVDFDSLPGGVKFFANILLALPTLVGMWFGYRAFHRLSNERQVRIFRREITVFVGTAGQLFLTIPAILLSGEDHAAVVFFVGLFLLSPPMSYFAWRSSSERFAIKPPAAPIAG